MFSITGAIEHWIDIDGSKTLPVIQNKTYHPDGYIPDGDFMEKHVKAAEKEVIELRRKTPMLAAGMKAAFLYND